MAKVDIESVYRLIPVYTDDCQLLAIKWYSEFFCNRMLPFGLSSVPKIYNAVADVLKGIIKMWG